MLKDTAKEIMNEMDELKDAMLKLVSIDEFLTMEPEVLAMLQKCISLYEKSKNFMIETAAITDEMNHKLDKVLELLEERA